MDTRVHFYDVLGDRQGSISDHDALDKLGIKDVVNVQRGLEPIDKFAGFKRCIASKDVVSLQSGEPGRSKLIFPVQGIREVVGLAVVDNFRSAEDYFLIETLLKVYSHQTFLLNKSERDALTGLLNREAFDVRMGRLVSRLMNNRRRQGRQGKKYLALLDIDYFKRVNDELGHLSGDEVLLHFSQLMGQCFRYYDELYRYGGEEFVVVLHDIEFDQAQNVMERFRARMEAYHYPQVGYKTVSIGLTEIMSGSLITQIVDKADRALYYAKENGRNQVHAYEKLIADGKLGEGVQAAAGGSELF